MKRIKIILILLLVSPLVGVFLASLRAGETGDESTGAPNLVVDVSAAVLNAAVQQQVDRTEPVDETIQETPVHGMGRTLANVWAELIPNSTQAVVDVVFQGRSYSRTIATRPHLLIHTSTTTSLDVRRRIVIDGAGITTFAGGQCADATTTLLDITSRGEPDWLAIRLGHRAFPASKDAAEAETAFKAARTTSRRMADDLSSHLASASRLTGESANRMRQAGIPLESLNFRTSAGYLQAYARFATPGKRPPGRAVPLPADIDLGVRIHQSLFNTTAQKALGGKTFPVNKVGDIFEETTQGLLIDGRKEDEQKASLQGLSKLVTDLAGKSATITLARKDPLTIDFANQGFTADIHVALIHQDGVEYAGMRALAEFRFQNYPEGVQAVRKGPVRFLPPADPSAEEKKLAAQPATFLLLREVLFAEVLKERLALRPIPVPEGMPGLQFLPPRGGANDGWLAITWSLAKRAGN